MVADGRTIHQIEVIQRSGYGFQLHEVDRIRAGTGIFLDQTESRPGRNLLFEQHALVVVLHPGIFVRCRRVVEIPQVRAGSRLFILPGMIGVQFDVANLLSVDIQRQNSFRASAFGSIGNTETNHHAFRCLLAGPLHPVAGGCE